MYRVSLSRWLHRGLTARPIARLGLSQKGTGCNAPGAGRFRASSSDAALAAQADSVEHTDSSPTDTHYDPASASNVRTVSPIEKPQAIGAAASMGVHHDLATYAAYAERTGLDTSSKTYVGTHYEYTVASVLKGYGFDMKRVGGRNDFGIDLLGTWSVPSSTATLRIILQCKVSATKTEIGPRLVRELEGAFVGAPPGWRGPGVIGMLVAQKPATKGIRDSLSRSRWPMGFISCLPDGRLQQMLWNRQAEENGLAGMGVGVRFAQEDDPQQQSLILTHQGRPFKFTEK